MLGKHEQWYNRDGKYNCITILIWDYNNDLKITLLNNNSNDSSLELTK